MAEPHSHDPHDVVVPESTRRLLILMMAPLLVAIVVGLVALWPGELRTSGLTDAVAAEDLFRAEVDRVTRGPCEGTEASAGIECSIAEVTLQEGPDDGETITLAEESVEGGADLHIGDVIVLAYYPDAGEGFEYSFADRERRPPLLLLVAVFAVAVIALGRWKGARALAGVGVSLAILATFILPALLDGSDPVLVALVGAGAIAVIALYLAHGVNVGSTIALIGAFASLALVALLAWGFVELTELSGRAAEEAGFLQITASQVRLQGLILAGVVIGTLGVLDDVTVLQVSAVWELHHANPEMPRRDIYRAAIRIGRDHIASTVNTLVLAYAGASLPLFLLLTQAHQGLSDIANSELVATEIVRTLVGSIGLVASVPITTLLATWVVGEHQRGGTAAPDDPRRYRSRTERQLWEQAAAAPVVTPEPARPPAPPDRAL
ncbi:MAG TPA: YibE/F family protein [Acidimicrobiales bacterium]|nr:YibE/F family protein [Acidimicrobiales bacterium]